VAGSYEHGNEPSSSIKAGKFLDQLSDHKLLKKSVRYLEGFMYSYVSLRWYLKDTGCVVCQDTRPSPGMMALSIISTSKA
jgi:hypothetical protein